jgi:hypothetical protein
VCAILDTIIWIQPARYRQSVPDPDRSLIADWTIAPVLFPKGDTQGEQRLRTSVRIKFIRLSWTEAKQLNRELNKQARHILHEHDIQLSSEAETGIEKYLGARLAANYIVTTHRVEGQRDMRRLLLVAWDTNVLDTKEERFQEEHVEASFFVSIGHVFNLCLA